MTPTTLHETPSPGSVTIEGAAPAAPVPVAPALAALTARLTTATLDVRRWLPIYEHPTVEEAREELERGFGADLLGSRLQVAEGVRDTLTATLAEAAAVLAAPHRPAPAVAPTDFAALRAQEQAAVVAGDVGYARIKLAEAVTQAAPLVPILRAAVAAHARVWLAAGRARLAERHAAEAESIAQTLARQRADLEAFTALAARWGVEGP